MQEALEHLNETDIEISELQQLLPDLVTTLSEHKRYKDPEVSPSPIDITSFKREKSTAPYCDLLSGLDERFSGDKTWSEKRPVLEKWTPGVKDGEMRGCWTAPVRFEWCVGEDEEESVGETK
jgi:hypothetical protein